MPYHFSGSWIRFGKCSSFFCLPDLNPFLRRNVHSIPFLNSIGIIKFLEITYHTVDPQNAGAMFVRFRHSLRIFAGCGSQPGFCIGPEKFIIIRGSLLFQHLQGTGILFRRTRRLYRFLILSAQLRHLCSTSKHVSRPSLPPPANEPILFFPFTLSFYFLLSAISPYLWKMYCEGNGFCIPLSIFRSGCIP